MWDSQLHNTSDKNGDARDIIPRVWWLKIAGWITWEWAKAKIAKPKAVSLRSVKGIARRMRQLGKTEKMIRLQLTNSWTEWGIVILEQIFMREFEGSAELRFCQNKSSASTSSVFCDQTVLENSLHKISMPRLSFRAHALLFCLFGSPFWASF